LGVGLFLVLTSLSRAMLFPRYAVRASPDAGAGVEGLERLWVTSDEGRVEGWLLPGRGVSAEQPGPAVIFAHGNAELIEHWPDEMARYRELGISVLLPEYRGYGRSAGSPSEAAITEDFVAFHELLVARPEVDDSRIVFHGRSLGGGAVCALARHKRPAAFILQSTFTSVADIARGWFVPRALVADPFDSREVLGTLRDTPVLIVHGERDSLIPVSHAHELARAAAGSRLVLYDCDHNDCPPRWSDFWREVEAFLDGAGLR
jgi:fermentation-respiration switch protein FrsA (DUF1100 family)